MDIPVAFADMIGNEESYVVDAIRSSWVSPTSEYLVRFEGDCANLC